MRDDLRQLLEQLCRDSVVLLKSQLGGYSTGFFVSADGLICTTHHGVSVAFGPVQLLWRGQEFPATLQPQLTRLDCAMLRVLPADLGVAATVPLPILSHRLTAQDVAGQIAALIYTPSDLDAPRRLRVLDGTSLSLEQYGASVVIETLDVMSGRGASGSPVFDLRRLRVIGYVQGELQGVTQRLGRVLPLDLLLERLSDLQPAWQAAGERFDAAKRALFQRPGQALPPSLAAPTDLAALARQHNQRLLIGLQRAGIYNDELFMPRSIAQRLDGFIAAASSPVAILTGEAGTGKTNLLVSLALRCSENVIPLLVTGAALDHSDTLLAKLPERLGFAGSLDEFALCLQRSPHRLLLIVDGYNEWPLASRSHLTQLVTYLGELSQTAGLPVQAIISIKLEFLREHVHELLVPGERAGTFPLHLLHLEEAPIEEAPIEKAQTRKQRARHYIQVPFLSDTTSSAQASEQRAMYEHFRALGKMRDAAGNDVGIRPQATYDELPEALRAFLDRPLLLRQFMMRYHAQPVPIGIVRSALYREVLTPNISNAGPQRLTREAIEVLLGNLAQHLCRAGVTALPYRELSRESWFDRGIIELLLAHTFFLSSTPCSGSMIGATLLGFSSEWLLQYYIAIDLWENMAVGTRSNTESLSTALAGCVAGRLDQLIGALCHIGEWALAQDHRILRSLLNVAAGPDHPERRAQFVASFLEFVRTHYSLTQPLPADVLDPPAAFAEVLTRCHDALDVHALQRILGYVERLGDDGLGDAIVFLESYSKLWSLLGANWNEEVNVVRALKWLRRDTHADVQGALEIVTTLSAAAVSPPRRALLQFVVGRCHQYLQRYELAIAAYELGGMYDDTYARQCRYQTAFVRYFAQSDYLGAISRLQDLRDSDRDDEQSNSLRSRCLTELAEFEAARALLETMLTRRRRGLPRARIQRDLARALALSFDTDAALRSVQDGCRLAQPASNPLVYLECREVQAFVLACHQGELLQALEIVLSNLAVAQRVQHAPTRSWQLQTAALIYALGGQLLEMEAALVQVAQLHPNPNQRRLSQFIRLLARHLTTQPFPEEPLQAELAALSSQYEEVGQKWYAVLLQLMHAVRAASLDPAAQFLERPLPGFDWENFWTSALAQAISTAQPLPMAVGTGGVEALS